MSKIIKESPLHYIKSECHISKTKDISVVEEPFLGYLNLRGDIKNKEFTRKVEKTLDLKIPQNPNSFNENNDYSIYWISPDEWLVTTKENQELKLEEQLIQELGEELFFAITNVSGGFTNICINGDKAQTLLKKGTTLDIHKDIFKYGECASTQFAKTALLIAKGAGKDEFNLIVRRSFAEYLWCYLATGCENL